MAARVDRLAELRRRVEKLSQSSAIIELQNSIWRLSEIERRVNKAARRAKLKAKSAQGKFAKVNPKEAAALASLPDYREKIATLAELEMKSANAEDEALLMFYRGESTTPTAEQKQVVQEVETGLQILLRQLLDLRHAHPNRVTMAVYSENKDALFELAQAYYRAALETQMQVTVSYYTANEAVVQAVLESQPKRPKKSDDDEPKMFGRKIVRQETNKPAEFLSSKPEAITAIVLSVEGKSAYAKCLGEHGPHAFVDGKTNNHVFVHVSDAAAKDYRVPSFLEKRGAIHPTNAGVARRTYWRGGSYVEDHLLETRRDWRNDLPAVLAFFMERNLQHAAERLLEE